MAKVLCVTGMHRSGTSLTASWLQKCGLTIDNGQLIGAAAGNYRGHFEDKEFVDLHSKIILEKNKNSKGWIEFSKNCHFQQRDKERAKLLLEERKNFELWGWKDPRSVLFLDEWIKLIPNLKFIFIWRPAFEVVASLIERNKNSTNPDFEINQLRAYRTWLHYNKEIINFCKSNPDVTLLININMILDNDSKFYNYISNRFGLNLEFTPIAGLVDKKLLNKKIFNVTDKVFYKLFVLSKVEKELDDLSYK